MSFLGGGSLFLLHGSPSWRPKYKNIVFFSVENLFFLAVIFLNFWSSKPGSGSRFTKTPGSGSVNLDPKHYLVDIKIVPLQYTS
jgi:hypothetical protein